MSRIADILALLLVIAIIYVLVRPSSQAALFVDAVGNALVQIVRRATDFPVT